MFVTSGWGFEGGRIQPWHLQVTFDLWFHYRQNIPIQSIMPYMIEFPRYTIKKFNWIEILSPHKFLSILFGNFCPFLNVSGLFVCLCHTLLDLSLINTVINFSRDVKIIVSLKESKTLILPREQTQTILEH